MIKLYEDLKTIDVLYSNKIRLESQLGKIKIQLANAQEECNHIPAQVFRDTTYCIICRKRLDTKEEDIDLLEDGPLKGNMPYETYEDKKIDYLHDKLIEVLDENPGIEYEFIKGKIEEKIKEEGYYDRKIKRYPVEI